MVRMLLSALIVVLGPLARAQVSGDVTAVSDYRYRGISLSGDRPAVQGGIGIDFRSGVYSGLFASTIDADFIESSALVQAYGGFARREGDTSWDAGASLTAFPHAADYRFAELHAGLTHDKWNVALHYAPRYFGRRVRTLYVEANAAWPIPGTLSWLPGVRVSLVAHGGVLFARSTGDELFGSSAQRLDGKAGMAFDTRWVKIELSYVAGDTPIAVYPVRRDSRRNALVASLSRAF